LGFIADKFIWLNGDMPNDVYMKFRE